MYAIEILPQVLYINVSYIKIGTFGGGNEMLWECYRDPEITSAGETCSKSAQPENSKNPILHILRYLLSAN